MQANFVNCNGQLLTDPESPLKDNSCRIVPGIRRLLANGTNDATFQPGSGAADGTGVKTMALQPDGKILLGGDFTSFSGVPCTGLVRLEANGAVDVSFVPPSITYHFPYVSNLLGLTEIELQPDGKILIVGGFTNLTTANGGSFVRDGLARLLPAGAVDATFDPGLISGWPPWSAARKILLQPNGRIVIGGDFTTVQGQSRYGLARLNADGSLDTTFFEPNAHSFYNVTAFALQADGNILVSANSGSPGLWRVQGDFTPRVRELTRTNGVAHLRLASRPGKTYALEASTNLVHWLPLQTNTATDCALEFLDAASPASRRFYRAVQLTP